MEHGEVVQLGRHRLLCGDAFNPKHVDALMQGVKPDMLYCDPPYGIDLKTDYKTNKRQGLTKWGKPGDPVVQKNDYPPVHADDQPFDPRPIMSRFQACREQFWWGANNYTEFLPSINEGSWTCWDKRLDERFDRMSGSAFELCWSKQRHQYAIARIRWVGFYGNQKEPGRKRVHPTHKPVALSEWFIEKYSKPYTSVLDLFGGSGSTLLACERLNRICYMAEISPDYCDIIIGRYEQMTQQPRLMEAM